MLPYYAVYPPIYQPPYIRVLLNPQPLPPRDLFSPILGR